MQIKFLFSAVFAALVLFVSSAASAMTIEVGYPYSALFDVTIKENIVPMFEKAHPGIKSSFQHSRSIISIYAFYCLYVTITIRKSYGSK